MPRIVDSFMENERAHRQNIADAINTLDTRVDMQFQTLKAGTVPASGGGTTNFLRADGTWAVPPGTASGPAAATQAEQEAASSTTVYTSPGRQHFHPGNAKCWGRVNFDTAGVPAITSSYGLSSISDNGVGFFTINQTTAQTSNLAYTVIGCSSPINTNTTPLFFSPDSNLGAGWSTTATQIRMFGVNEVLTDPVGVGFFFCIFGDLP